MWDAQRRKTVTVSRPGFIKHLKEECLGQVGVALGGYAVHRMTRGI